jgi:NADH-quinone oxidoreductase subunit N
MTSADLITLLPLIVLSLGLVAIILLVAFYRNHPLTFALTLLVLTLSFFSLAVASSSSSVQITTLLTLDRYALFYMGLLFATTFATVGLSYGYLKVRPGNREEFYILLLLATLGAAVLVASTHFACFFLGLEILSVALYALIAYPRLWGDSLEAGLKYLILAGASAAFLVFGMALVYAGLGTMEFSRIASLLQSTLPEAGSIWVLAGLGMLVVGIGFKLAVVPFHLWTPDVYEGAPAPVSGFVATVSKGAVVALLLRFFLQIDFSAHSSLFFVFSLIAVASMCIGNLMALFQTNVKRILAYSSIAHLGYLLVAFLASGSMALTAVAFYLVAYFITTLGGFGVITLMSNEDRDADRIDDYRGLFWQRPWLGGVFTAMLLSLAGIPLTAGFIGKFYLVLAGVGSALWLLVVVLVLTSGIGLFYYLRVILPMYEKTSGEEEAVALSPSVPVVGGVVVAGLTLLLVWLGVLPAPVMELIRTMFS